MGARRVFEESTDLSRFASFMRSTDHRIGSIVAGERSTRRRRLVRWTLGAAAAVLLAVCAGTAWHFLSTPDIYRVYENTGDAVTTVTLDDGTHVWLNARTKLTLPEAFGPTQRNVQLAGAAFFEVARDEAAPFVVSTDKLRVRVLGTSFCMQAYEGSQQAEVVLEHGSVRLQTPAGVNLVTLQPDQRALYDAADDNLAITQVNASHLVLTQYDLVTMSDATLHEIISHIETTFGVRLSVPGLRIVCTKLENICRLASPPAFFVFRRAIKTAAGMIPAAVGCRSRLQGTAECRVNSPGMRAPPCGSQLADTNVLVRSSFRVSGLLVVMKSIPHAMQVIMSCTVSTVHTFVTMPLACASLTHPGLPE